MTTGQSEHLHKDGSIDIDAIYDLPYSQLTDAEIDAIVEYKAGIKARDEQFSQIMQIAVDNGNKVVDTLKEEYETARQQQDDLLGLAMANLKAAREEAGI